jgi:hypothetical protein
MVEMLEELGPVIGVTLAVMVMVLLLIRWSFGLHASEQREVARFDEALIALAARTGLRYLPAPVDEHPMMGSIRRYGCVVGKLHGVQVSVAVVSEPDSETSELCISVDRDPAAPANAEAVAGLQALGLEARIEARRLVAVPRPRRKTIMGLPTDVERCAEVLEQYVRATVDAVSPTSPATNA